MATQDERLKQAQLRGYEFWRVREFLVKLRKSKVQLTEFLFLHARWFLHIMSRESQASPPVAQLLDTFHWDLNHTEKAAVFSALQEDFKALGVEIANYYEELARQLEPIKVTQTAGTLEKDVC